MRKHPQYNAIPKKNISTAKSILLLLRKEEKKWSDETLSEKKAGAITHLVARTISMIGCKVKIRISTTESWKVTIECSKSCEHDFIFQNPVGDSFRRIPKAKVPLYARQAAACMSVLILKKAIGIAQAGIFFGLELTMSNAPEAVPGTLVQTSTNG